MMAFPEKTIIWGEIKAAVSDINKSGSNGIEVLLWSQDKNLKEVRERIKEIRAKVTDEYQNETTEDKEKCKISKDQRS